MQWSSVFTVVFRVKLRVSMVHAYPRCVDKHKARAVMEGIDRTTRCG
jgi:AhpD family alkylhydroperoxidase